MNRYFEKHATEIFLFVSGCKKRGSRRKKNVYITGNLRNPPICKLIPKFLIESVNFVFEGDNFWNTTPEPKSSYPYVGSLTP